MTKGILQALEQLAQEQLEAQHTEVSTSPWNFPLFVITKRSGKMEDVDRSQSN